MDVARSNDMRSPSEIAAQAVQDELYARAAFARLIALTPADFRSKVENDAHIQTEFMARHILEYYEDNFQSIPPEDALKLVEVARCAARDGEPHLRCRVEKDLANAFRFLGRFGSAKAALQCASSFVSQTLAREVHRGTIEFSWAAFCESTGHPIEATKYAESAIRAFEENGARDRAYVVRIHDAYMKCMGGQHLPALRMYQDAARRARELGSEENLASS